MAIALGFQRELSMLCSIMSGSRVSLGRVGEQYCKVALEANGYLTDIDHQKGAGDLRTVLPDGQVLRIETKIAKLNKDGHFQFCITKWKNGQMFTDCSGCDALMCLGIRQSGMAQFWIIPIPVVKQYKKIQITGKLNDFSAKWMGYRQHLGNLNFKEILRLKDETMALRDSLYGSFPNGYSGIPVLTKGA